MNASSMVTNKREQDAVVLRHTTVATNALSWPWGCRSLVSFADFRTFPSCVGGACLPLLKLHHVLCASRRLCMVLRTESDRVSKSVLSVASPRRPECGDPATPRVRHTERPISSAARTASGRALLDGQWTRSSKHSTSSAH